MAQHFIEYGKTFWSDLTAYTGFTFSNKNLIANVPENSGVTPFRAFRFENKVVVLIEPIHTSGAYVEVFENKAGYYSWKDEHMRIDIKNRDM